MAVRQLSAFPGLFGFLIAWPYLLGAETTVTLSTSPNPSTFGAPVLLRATIAPPNATGRVTFYDGVTVLGTKSLISGAASISTIALPAGSRKLTAYYSGDATYGAATSNVFTQTVKAVAGGTFIPQNPLSLPAVPSSVVVGDFNGDGIADFVFPGIANGSDTTFLTVVLGAGNGSFQAPANYGLGTTGASFITAGDFNGDGVTDLAVTRLPVSVPGRIQALATVNVSVLLGNGDGTFGPAVDYLVGSYSGLVGASFGPVAVGDFNSDGKADLAVSYTMSDPINNLNSSGFAILLGNGDGTFVGGAGYLGAMAFGLPFAVADFNGDGKPDLATDRGVLPGKGDGTFQPLVNFSLATGVGVTSLVAGDFNGDGKADLAVGGSISNSGSNGGTATTWILLGNGDGTFQPAVAYPFGAAVMQADFIGRGSIDLVVADSSGNMVGILEGRGDGTFQPGLAISTGAPLAIADFNGDGRADILTAGSSGAIILVGSTGAPGSLLASGGTPQSTPVGTPFPNALKVTVKDSTGNPLGGITVTFTSPASGPGATLSSTAAVTNASGVASVTAAANNTVGSYVVTASLGTLSVSFSLTNTSGSGGATNLALGKTVTQSSTLGYPTAGAASAVDGNPDGSFFDGSVTATNLDPNPWWQVDLGASATVTSVVLWNRTDCCGSRLSDYWVFISDTPFLPTDTPTTLQNRAGTFGSHQTAAPDPSTAIAAGAQGRYVRVQLSGANYLSLAEVQVLGTGGPAILNLSQGKTAAQSSTLPGAPTAVASSAVDGNPDGDFFRGSVTATNLGPNPWWQVDLGASATVSSIVIWNRTDCCGSRLGDFWVFVSDTPFLPTDTPSILQNRGGTFASHQTTATTPSAAIAVRAQGRYVRLQLSSANYLSLAEVQVFGTGSPGNL